MDKLLRIEEAAVRLGVNFNTVRGMLRSGRLVAIRPTGGRAVRVREADVEALMQRQTIGAVK